MILLHLRVHGARVDGCRGGRSYDAILRATGALAITDGVIDFDSVRWNHVTHTDLVAYLSGSASNFVLHAVLQK
ncbi:MAG: hypothetical protein ABI831_24950 [Betaproteobacteria bacterium]